MMNTFETNLQRLEELTAQIKKPDISLEDALKDFEEGITLAKKLEKDLNAIEGKIQILMNGDEATSSKTKAKAAPELDLFTPSTELNGTRNG